ncbi:MAG TPA: MBL fold metallo-hydrolase [Leptospiraceae bacterium]|nr:MBL fold metallo-hydrolase [Leptospiraceae bacterium]HMY69817.1 MBL fold metallo-hydrolase [Leptospiraceae bacterium]HNF16234.1 MBL fold metallo-hydrolase [Leptospiraceae bacterium]HNF28283.1 MBL fold metallo-hydrolase [Leptospiraceae bacterium]HNM06672.1 MBL fold metallo-hydrolase [Leptospiraceae bacterium]
MSFEVRFLKAGSGDAILVRFKGKDGKFHNILVDGGNANMVMENLIPEIGDLLAKENENLDSIFITHSDNDHVLGIESLIHYLRNANQVFRIKNISFNQHYLIHWYTILESKTPFLFSSNIENKRKLNSKTTFRLEEFLYENKFPMNNTLILAGNKFSLNKLNLTVISPYNESLARYWKEEVDQKTKDKISSTTKLSNVKDEKQLKDLFSFLNDG